MIKKFQVLMIDTDARSHFGFLTTKGKEVFKDLRFYETESPQILDSKNQLLLFLNDDKIKSRDLVYDFKLKKTAYYSTQRNSMKACKKVIMCTNPLLCECEDVELIPNDILREFVEEWNKNNNIKEITITTKFK